MGFILSYIALILFVAVYILDEFTCLFIDVRKRKWFYLTSKRKYSKAFKVDVFANFLFPDFWNLIFSKGGYEFGIFGETLSSCIGRKQVDKTLSKFGLCFYYLLYAIDFTKWKQGGHCNWAIMSEEQINNFLKK